MSTPSFTNLPHAFTVDVEDWFHIMDCKQMPLPERYASYEARVVRNTERILEVLGANAVKATFFFLGWVAEQNPRLVRRVADAGHEIGVHGFHHVPAYEMSDDDLRHDTFKAVEVVGEAAGKAPVGYRSPGGTLLSRQAWIFDELLGLGIWFDSSVYPRSGMLMNDPYPERPFRLATPGGSHIWEFPSVTHDWLGMKWAFGEGGYLRLLPRWKIQRWFADRQREGGMGMVCIHPRELDPDQPRLPLTLFKQWKTQVGMASVREKLVHLLSNHQFCPMGECLFQYEKQLVEKGFAG